MSIPLGAHVDQTDPIAEAKARQAPHVQFFLGDPQGYKGPEFRYAGGADGLRADAEAAGIDLYVHAPYIVNVATTNNRIRIPSRKLLQQHVDAAAAIGARGLIVHGGHVNNSRDAFDSGADRHASLGAGTIAPDLLAAVVRDAGAPVVCETPGGPAE